jgi:hypothetical protein
MYSANAMENWFRTQMTVHRVDGESLVFGMVENTSTGDTSDAY